MIIFGAGGVVRELQKAKQEVAASNENAFKAFEGKAQRIDGKAISPDKVGKDDSKSSREEIAAKRLAAMSGGSKSSCGGSSSGESPASVFVEQRASKIGDKYSKKKSAVTAFTGKANTLT